MFSRPVIFTPQPMGPQGPKRPVIFTPIAPKPRGGK